MYELIQISKHDYYIDAPAKVGIVTTQSGEVFLIDSGSDKDAARKVRQILAANGWQPTAILTTHSHADHVGGNKYLAAQTGCRIYAPGIECAFTRAPILESAYLFGGFPPRELRHKFLLAEPSDAIPLSDDALPAGMYTIPLPGHFFDMVGFGTGDGTVFLADCLSSHETLQKYGINFLYDVGAYLDTLARVKTMEAKIFVPSHAAPCTDITPLAAENEAKVWEVASRICDLLKEPLAFEVLLSHLFTMYRLTMNHIQYALVGSTVRSYLSWLSDRGEIGSFVENNMLLWQKT